MITTTTAAMVPTKVKSVKVNTTTARAPNSSARTSSVLEKHTVAMEKTTAAITQTNFSAPVSSYIFCKGYCEEVLRRILKKSKKFQKYLKKYEIGGNFGIFFEYFEKKTIAIDFNRISNLVLHRFLKNGGFLQIRRQHAPATNSDVKMVSASIISWCAIKFLIVPMKAMSQLTATWTSVPKLN